MALLALLVVPMAAHAAAGAPGDHAVFQVTVLDDASTPASPPVASLQQTVYIPTVPASR